MFRELAAALPEKGKTGIVTLTVAREDDTHLRITVQPYPHDGPDAPKLTPVAFVGTPEELDCTPIDFSPAANVADHGSIDEQVKRSAKDNADKPATAKTAPAKTPTPTTKAPAKPAGKSTAVKSSAEIAAEKAKKAEDDKRKADEAAAAKAKKEADDKAKKAEEARKKKAEEIARLQAELKELNEPQAELPVAGGS